MAGANGQPGCTGLFFSGPLRVAAGQDVARFQLLPAVHFNGPVGRQTATAAAPAAGTTARRSHCLLQFLILCPDVGRQDLLNLFGIDAQHREIIVGNLLLRRRAVLFRLQNDRPNIGRQHGDAVIVQLLLIRSDQRIQRTFGSRPFLLSFIERLALRHDLLGSGHGYLLDNQRIEERLHGVKVALQNRVVHVVMALGASHREAHEGRGDGFHRHNRHFLRVLVVANHVAARQKSQREHIVQPRLHF